VVRRGGEGEEGNTVGRSPIMKILPNPVHEDIIVMSFSAPPAPPKKERRNSSISSFSGKGKSGKKKKKLTVQTTENLPKPPGRRTSSALTAMAGLKSKTQSPGNKVTDKPSKLSRQRTAPTTKSEKTLTAGKETRLAALAVLRKLIQTTRPNVGAIVTVDELELLEKTVRTAANLDHVTSFRKEGSGLDDLRAQQGGADGNELDDEIYKSLKAYMTVQVEKPKERFKRAVRSLGGMTSIMGKLKAGAAAMEREAQEEALEADEVPSYILDGVTRWSFNVFEVEKESKNGALVWVCENLVKKCGLDNKLSVNKKAQRGWLLKVQGAYGAQEDVPYHNSMHGADVCQTTYCLMENSDASKLIENKMKYVALLAAACHDCGHKGFNNNFLVNTNDPLALTYCYDAPLERMHAAKGFEMMREKDCDAFGVFDGEDLKKARKW